MSSVFTVTVKDFANINKPEESVDFFRELLWAEATKWKIPKSKINVPSNINAADGGVDAEVKDVTVPSGSGLIKQGLTRYQLKTGDYRLDAGGIRKLLFNEGNGELKPRIRSCLEQDGAFVVVLFDPRVDNPDKDELTSLENRIREELGRVDTKYLKARIEVLMPNMMASYVNSFPSLSLKLKRLEGQGFFSHSTWASLPDMRVELKMADRQLQKLEQFKREIREADRAVHIRVNGEPGIGKTRFVLEMLRDEDMAPLVVYCDTPEAANSALLSHVRSADNEAHVMLVVDECDRISMMNLWQSLEGCGRRLKLITIYSEADDDIGGETRQLEIEELEDDQVANIIKIYGSFAEDQVKRWVPYCGGSPRVAHVVGQNLLENPDDLLKSPDTVPVWERFLAGKDKMETQTYEQRKEVMMWLSLFKKFGYGAPNDAEFELLAKKIESRTKFPFSTIHAVIQDMKARKVLQGKRTLYITPKLLHIKLWTWWWKKYGDSRDANIDEFIVIDGNKDPPVQLSGDLVKWYCEMFRYAKESEEASKVVKDLLGPGGPFQDKDFFGTGIGSRFFLALTEANPEAALRALQRTVGNQTKDQLLQFREGRRTVISALEKIAIDPRLFQDSARLLLALGEAENESWANNASGIFAAMFSSGYGKVAPTAAPPEMRFPVLKEAMESHSKARRILALKACDAALETFHWIGIARPVDEGVSKEPELWMPKTWGEWFDALQRVWKFLFEKVEQLPDDEKREAIQILLDRSRGLTRIESLAPIVLDTIEA
ncbi:MAG: hypothetical protein HRF40_14760, partial [Nitrososphaera sp.]